MIPDTPNNIKSLINAPEIYSPSVYKPSVTEKDYNNGFINRYFVGRINYEDFFETSIMDYNLAPTNFYKKIIIKWKITGPKYNIYTGKMLETVGVVDYNFARISEARVKFPEIQMILTDLTQFWRGY